MLDHASFALIPLALAANLEECTTALLAAQKELMKLMEADSMRRFQKHFLWEQMLEKMRLARSCERSDFVLRS